MADESRQARDDAPEAAGCVPAFPPGPAWAVGADREHSGPSGMGPGEDQPGFGGEIDQEDAEGVAGGHVRTDREAGPVPPCRQPARRQESQVMGVRNA